MTGPAEHPAMERTRVRVLVGHLRALSKQAGELSPETRARIFGSGLMLVDSWQKNAADLHASTTDAPSETDRARTMDAA